MTLTFLKIAIRITPICVSAGAYTPCAEFIFGDDRAANS